MTGAADEQPSSSMGHAPGLEPTGPMHRVPEGEVLEKGGRHRLAWLAFAGLAAFALVAADTWLRGPLSAGVVGMNDLVVAWNAQGLPVHPVGWALSQLGDFLIGIPVIVLALSMCLRAKAWGRAIAILGMAAAGPGVVFVTQQWLTGKNRPIIGLDPILIPDTNTSPPRIAGMHLFPSGHSLEAVLDWGLLAMVAVPIFTAFLEFDAKSARRWHRVAIVAWLLAALLTGIGRTLRQAHGYNDIVAGWVLGFAILFGGLWGIETTRAWRRARRLQKERVAIA